MVEDNINGVSQYLTFRIDSELYALNVKNVQEVQEYTTVSRVPRMPDYMRGIINLRGSVVPVLDLKIKFGLGITEKDIDTSIIVTEVILDNDTVVMGLMADSVNEVIDMKESEIEPTPYIGTKIDTAFIKGMGRKGDDFLIVLNINKVLSINELTIFATHEKEEITEKVSL